MSFLHDLRRRAGRHEHAVPLVAPRSPAWCPAPPAGPAGAEPALAGVRDRLDLAALAPVRRRRAVGEEELHLPRHHVVERRPAAAIRDVVDLDAGGALEQFQATDAAACRCPTRRSRGRPASSSQGDHVGHRLRLDRRRHHQDVGHQRGQEHRLEVLAVVERQLGIERPDSPRTRWRRAGSCSRPDRTLAATASPMVPPAPPRLSMTNDLPHISPSFWNRMRAVVSAPPAGG